MESTIYHGTPLTPRDALLNVCAGRAMCVSFFRPDDLEAVERIAPWIMYDNGAFSFWRQAARSGAEFDETERDWIGYYEWLDRRLWEPGRWAIIPDRIFAPSQLNDALLNDWPHGTARGAPVWHMDGPILRLARLAERYDRVCLGWTGDPKAAPVGCDAYRRKMDEVSALFGNRWPATHMLRGVAVARDYPFRQRGQHVSRAKRPSVRLARRAGSVVRQSGALVWEASLRRSAGRRAA